MEQDQAPVGREVDPHVVERWVRGRSDPTVAPEEASTCMNQQEVHEINRRTSVSAVLADQRNSRCS